MEYLEKALNYVLEYQGMAVTVGLLSLEVLFRLTKSDKLISIPRIIAKGAHVIAAMLEAVATVFDKVVPDKRP